MAAENWSSGKILEWAIGAVGATLIIFLLCFMYTGMNHADKMDKIDNLAAKSLSLKQNLSEEIHGHTAYAEFKAGEYKNVATVSYQDHTYTRQDLNKSRILGHVVAEKGGEFLGGIKDKILGKKRE